MALLITDPFLLLPAGVAVGPNLVHWVQGLQHLASQHQEKKAARSRQKAATKKDKVRETALGNLARIITKAAACSHSHDQFSCHTSITHIGNITDRDNRDFQVHTCSYTFWSAQVQDLQAEVSKKQAQLQALSLENLALVAKARALEQLVKSASKSCIDKRTAGSL